MSAPIYDPYADYEAQEIRRSVVANPDTITHNLCSYEAQEPAQDGKGLSLRDFNPLRLRPISVCLHIILILLHVALFVVWWYQFEERVIVPLNLSGITSSAIVAASQGVALIYTAVLLLITQRLAMKGILHKYQTLTATHDQFAAWTGLGSALSVLWSQTRIAASVIGTLSITIYLVGISVLHISTPSLFNLQVFNNPNGTTIPTQIGMPQINEAPKSPDPFWFWMGSTATLPYLSHADTGNMIGVLNNTLYDIVSVNNGTGNVLVGAQSINVTCGSVQNPTAIGTPSNQPTMWNVSGYYANSDFSFNLSETAQCVVGSAANLDFSADTMMGRSLIFYVMGPVNVTDSSGNIGSMVSLNPPMAQAQVNDITLIGCTLSITTNQSAVVDAQTKALVSVEPLTIKTTSEWQIMAPSSSAYVFDPQIDGWKQMMALMAQGQAPTVASTVVPPQSRNIDVGSQYVMEQLGLFPQYLDQGGIVSPPFNTTLHQFENALANMTALVYWASANIQSDTWIRNLTGFNGNVSVSVLQGSARISTAAARLKINVISLAVGFGTSIILLTMACIMMYRLPGVGAANIDASGILSCMWIAYWRPQLQDLFLRVVEPTTDNLRTMGMVEVQLRMNPHLSVENTGHQRRVNDPL